MVGWLQCCSVTGCVVVVGIYMASLGGTHPRVLAQRREKITALPLYHSGHLRVKTTGTKVFAGYFGELRGSTIFLYTDEQIDTYCHRLKLQGLTGMELDPSSSRRGPCTYILSLPDQTISLQVDSPDTGEKWRGFIMTVATLQIPSQLQLLPGQTLQLQEVLDQERQRASLPITQSPSDHTPRPRLHMTHGNSEPPVPPGFHKVTRQEAERMLIDSPEYGEVILRPAAKSNSYALTVRHKGSSGGMVLRHYKVRPRDSGFVIDLKNTPVSGSSLHDVLLLFLSQTRQYLRPHIRPPTPDTDTYDTSIA
ncbi:unnamed protein product [Coregonus sp. 'balchen']|nr:unnamed protein product [Coregonus sp. 'balchen']